MTEKNRANHTDLHKLCVNAILLKLGREPDATFYQNSKVQIVRGQPRAMPGLTTGASDIIFILGPHGRIGAIEVKTGSAVPTPKQRMFLELVRKRGGFACIVHADSEDEAVANARAALDRARQGLPE